VTEEKLSEHEIINEVINIWSNALDIYIKKDDDFFDIGGESLIAIDIISDLNKRFGLSLQTNTLSDLSTPQLVGNYIYKIKNKYILNGLENISKIVSSDSSHKNLFLIHPAG
jgi:acyl carrier protein